MARPNLLTALVESLQGQAMPSGRELFENDGEAKGKGIGVRELRLTQGLVALVDDEDFALVSAARWHATVRSYTTYAANSDSVYLHRLLMRPGPGQLVDHINRNGLDCRRSNMRLATKAQNNANSCLPPVPRTSRYRGVYLDRVYWKTQVKMPTGRRVTRIFRTEAEAARMYNALAVQSYGPFARLNVIEEDTMESYPDRSHDNEYCDECGCVTNHTTESHRASEAEGPQEL